MILGCHQISLGHQGVFQSFSGVMLNQLPSQARYSLPFQTHQLEGSLDELSMLQVGCVGQVDLADLSGQFNHKLTSVRGLDHRL